MTIIVLMIFQQWKVWHT